MVSHSRAPFSPLSKKAKAQLEALGQMPDESIDTSDIPSLPESFWKNAIRNPYYKPVKKQLTVRLDADLIAWLRGAGKGYQTRINEMLRREMLKERMATLNAEPGAKKHVAGRRVQKQAAVSQQNTAAKRMR